MSQIACYRRQEARLRSCRLLGIVQQGVQQVWDASSLEQNHSLLHHRNQLSIKRIKDL